MLRPLSTLQSLPTSAPFASFATFRHPRFILIRSAFRSKFFTSMYGGTIPPLPKSLWGQAKMYGTHRDLGKGGIVVNGCIL
jgi:hypothetical protein